MTLRRRHRSRNTPTNGPTSEYGSSSTANAVATRSPSGAFSGLNSRLPASADWKSPSPNWLISRTPSKRRNGALPRTARRLPLADTPEAYGAGAPRRSAPCPSLLRLDRFRVGRAVAQAGQQGGEVDTGQIGTELQSLCDIGRHVLGQRGRAVGTDDGHLVDRGHRRGRLLDHLREHPDQQVQHRRLAVLVERLRLGPHRLRLGLAAREDGGRFGGTFAFHRVGDGGAPALLRLTLLGTLDRVGVGERGPPGPLALPDQPVLLGGGLGGGDGGPPLRVGPPDRRVAGGLRPLVALVPGRVRPPAHPR